MISQAKTVEAYLEALPKERIHAMRRLRETILNHLPSGLEETMSYGMIGYVIPHSIYPNGYHVNPKDPVPFMAIASQKHYIALYYMGFMVSKETLDWFVEAYQKATSTKLDMGKSCIRFKKVDAIPYQLIEALCQKVSVEMYLEAYTKMLNK